MRLIESIEETPTSTRVHFKSNAIIDIIEKFNEGQRPIRFVYGRRI
jgi:hypothetical protein